MRAIVITAPGGPEVLTLGGAPTPEPRAGEIRVRVHAFGINRADLLQRRGLYPAPPDAPADIPGLEYAGVVDALGPGVQTPAIGSRVMGIVGGGAYAEFLVTPAVLAIPIPRDLPFAQAAAIPEAFLTARDALWQLDVQPREWVLVHAVGSGVGTAATQLIRAFGASTIGTSRSRDKLERARALGLVVPVETGTDDLVERVRQATGRGANAAIDLVGGALFPATMRALAPRGRLIVVGLTAGRTAEIDLGLLLNRRLRVIGTVLRSRPAEEKRALVEHFIRTVLPLFERDEVHPVLDRTFDFEHVRDAHAYVEQNTNFGKVVVQVLD